MTVTNIVLMRGYYSFQQSVWRRHR